MTILLGTGIRLNTSRRADGGSPAPSFAPAAMFAAGEKGAWYDPSDLSTLFQDAAKNIPVTAHNQPVGVMKDKSGNGIHLIAPSDDARPLYQEAGNRRSLAFFDGAKMLVSSNTFFTRTADDSVYLAAATDNSSLSGSWSPIVVGDGITGAGVRNRFSLSYSTVVGSTSYFSEVRDAAGNSYRMGKSAATAADSQTHYEDFYIPAGAQPSNPPVAVSSQIDGQALAQAVNDGPDPIIASMKVGLGTLNFSAPASNDINYWYGGIIALRSLTQNDRTNLRAYFSDPR